MSSSSRPLARLGRILTFRATRDELLGLGARDLALGLVFTWLVGMGRWWDDPDASLPQHLGLGSLAYVVALSAALFVLLFPLRPAGFSYRGVLAFVSLTSPPGLLYAVPVERFMSIEVATRANLYALLLVATWRVSLWLFYLRRAIGLRAGEALAVGLLPLAAIVFTLFQLNLHRVVLRIMGGLDDGPPNAHQTAYEVLGLLTFCSVFAVLPLAIAYLAIVRRHVTQRRAGEEPG